MKYVQKYKIFYIKKFLGPNYATYNPENLQTGMFMSKIKYYKKIYIKRITFFGSHRNMCDTRPVSFFHFYYDLVNDFGQ